MIQSPPGWDTIHAVVQEGVGTVFPAATLLVEQDGERLIHQAYGCLDPGPCQYPTRPDSLLDLASLTKLFTATAFMTLAEAGRVTLETKVVQVLPEFAGVRPIGITEDPLSHQPILPDPAFVGQSVDAGGITFRHLLTHTSGLPGWTPLFKQGPQLDPVPTSDQVSPEARSARVSAIWADTPFAYPTGKRLVYSDLGLILLGEAVARLADMPLERYLAQAIFEPLGLTRTAFNPMPNGFSAQEIAQTEVCAWRKRRCVGEVHDENAASLGGVAGHAGLFSTAEDVAALGRMFLPRRPDFPNSNRSILSQATVGTMTQAQAHQDGIERGLAWLRQGDDPTSIVATWGPESFGHTGFTGTSLWIDPDAHLLVVLLTNRVYGGRDPAGIMAFRRRFHAAIAAVLATTAQGDQHG